MSDATTPSERFWEPHYQGMDPSWGTWPNAVLAAVIRDLAPGLGRVPRRLRPRIISTVVLVSPRPGVSHRARDASRFVPGANLRIVRKETAWREASDPNGQRADVADNIAIAQRL